MQSHLKFRATALSKLTDEIGCYILADLDNIPIYVGQSTDGIRSRVRRHLTSARSDIIANRQVDVWEIAYVWAFPVAEKTEINSLENALFHEYDKDSQLMNGSIPAIPEKGFIIPAPFQVLQLMSDEDLMERSSPEARLPRQAEHYARLVDHYLVVKQSQQIARSMEAHFERLKKYQYQLLGLGKDDA